MERPLSVARGSVGKWENMQYGPESAWESVRNLKATVKRFVAVAGNMGVGKTSMVSFLCSQYGFDPVYEPFMENPYLDDFYRDMRKWAFHSQLYFLTIR